MSGVWVGLATAFVAVVQIRLAQAPLYGYDEAWHLYLSAVSPITKALEEMAVDPHPPLYYLLLRPLTYIGPEPFWPRLLSVLATIALVPLWYLLLRKLDLGRAVAATLTLTLALSHGFNELGLTVRAYSLAALCLVAALWFWADFMGVSRARPSRGSLRALLALLTAAFWLSYYAVFFSAALVAASVLAALSNPGVRTGMLDAWRQYFRWPERIGVFALHGLGIGWLMIGYGRAGVAAPPHVSSYLLQPGQDVPAFLRSGLGGYLELFTPLIGLGAQAQVIALLVLGLALVWLLQDALRRGAAAHAALLLAIPLVLSMLFLTGVAGLYPFGGYLRHQHLLLFLLLLALGIGLQRALGQVHARMVRWSMLLLVVGIAAVSSAVAMRQDSLGEMPPARPLAGVIDAAFGADGELAPVYTAVYPFYILYADRFAEGIDYRASYGHLGKRWVDVGAVGNLLRALRIRREWDEYIVAAESGQSVSLYRDRTLFQWPQAPGTELFERLHELMDRRALHRLWVLHAPSDGASHESRHASAGDAFARHGFRVLRVHVGDQGVAWLISRSRAND